MVEGAVSLSVSHKGFVIVQYVILVRSQLTYCSQLWNPYLIKDTVILEKIQRQATKFILSDYVSDYKTRLLKLDLLPLI